MKSLNIIANIRPGLHILLLALLLGTGSCATGNEAAGSIQEEVSPDPADNLYLLTDQQFNSAGMVTGPITQEKFFDPVRTTGMFDVPPGNKASISAYYGGYVREIGLLPGQAIRKGEVLFVLENPEYVQMQQDFLEAQSRLEYLRSDYERQKDLAEVNIASRKQFLKAESDYTVTRVQFESLRKKLELMNIHPERLSGDNLQTEVPVFSPLNGYVTTVNANRGMYIDPGDVAVTLVDPAHLHLELTIFEKDLPYVEVGQTIRFGLQNGGGKTWRATVHLINQTVDPEKRTVTVHGHLNDETMPSAFVPGMFVEAEILTRGDSLPALPDEAVVEADGRQWVLIRRDIGGGKVTFEKREVQTGRSGNGFTAIHNHADFSKDAQFLLRGAFRLIRE